MKSFHHLLPIVFPLIPLFGKEVILGSDIVHGVYTNTHSQNGTPRFGFKGIVKSAYMNEKRLQSIPPDTSAYCVLRFPDGSFTYLEDRPDGTLLLNQDGCKIVQHENRVLLFNRLNLDEDSWWNVFDGKFTIYVPPGRQLVLILEGGARIVLEGDSQIAFFPCDSYHPVKEHPVEFSGEGSFEFIGGDFTIFTPHLQLSGVEGSVQGRLNIIDRAVGAGSLIENNTIKLRVKGYGTYTSIPRFSKIEFYGDGSSRIDQRQYLPDLTCQEGSFILSGKTAPMVLREFVKWYGLKDFVCKPGIDTNMIGFMEKGPVSKDAELRVIEYVLEREVPDCGYRLNVMHDTLFLIPTDKNSGSPQNHKKLNWNRRVG